MKKLVLLLLTTIGLLYAEAQSTQSTTTGGDGPASCLKITDSAVIEVSPGIYKIHLEYENVTSGKKSFKVSAVTVSGTCFTSICIEVDANGVGVYDSPNFNCSSRPILSFEPWTGGNGCNGQTCGVLIILPLNLTSITARKESDNSVNLIWSATLGSIEPNTVLKIERSLDGKRFFEVFTMFPNTEQVSFSWKDKSSLSGVVFYRLKIQENGGYKYSKIVSVRITGTTSLDFGFSNTEVFIRQIPVGSTIELRDMIGRLLPGINKTGDTNMTIPISHLTPGIYTISVRTGKDLVSKRFIKQ